MSRLIRTDNSLHSLQMKCFYISTDYETPKGLTGPNYLKDIFEE